MTSTLTDRKKPPTAAPAHEDRDFVVSRLLHAPRELAFRAWTNPRRLAQWWGPRGFTSPTCQVDARPGGAYRLVMRGPDGVRYPMKGTFTEVRSPEFLAMTEDFSEHPAEWLELLERSLPPGTALSRQEAECSVTFEEEGEQTRLTVRTRFESGGVRDAMLKLGTSDGWGESLDRLEEHLAAEHSLTVSRFIPAPRDVVFGAWTDPVLLAGWWRPSGFDPPVVERLDVREGGGFRFLMRHREGTVYTARGVYREVRKPERLVYDDYCDEDGTLFHRALLTVTFGDHSGGTNLTIHGRFRWVPDRDLRRWTPGLMLQGWLDGWRDNLDLLEAQLEVAKAA